MGLYQMLEALLLMTNAVAILNEDRFLSPMGLGIADMSNGRVSPFKSQMVGFIHAVQYLRVTTTNSLAPARAASEAILSGAGVISAAYETIGARLRTRSPIHFSHSLSTWEDVRTSAKHFVLRLNAIVHFQGPKWMWALGRTQRCCILGLNKPFLNQIQGRVYLLPYLFLFYFDVDTAQKRSSHSLH